MKKPWGLSPGLFLCSFFSIIENMEAQMVLARLKQFLSRKLRHSLNHSFSRLPVSVFLPTRSSFEGDIETDALVRIEGKMIGRIKSSVVIVAQQAKTTAEVEADCLYVEGNFQGIARTRLLYLAHGGSVNGEVRAESLYVHQGAFMKGKVAISKREGE